MSKPFYEKKSAGILSLLLPAAGVLFIVVMVFFRWHVLYLKVDKSIFGGFTIRQVVKDSLKSMKINYRGSDLILPVLILFTLFMILYIGYLGLRKRLGLRFGLFDKLYDSFRVVSYILPALYILLIGYLFMIKNYRPEAKAAMNRQLICWIIFLYAVCVLWMLLVVIRPLLPQKNSFLNQTIDRFRLASRLAPVVMLPVLLRLLHHTSGYILRKENLMEMKMNWSATIARYKELGIGTGMKCSIFHGFGFWFLILGIVLYLGGLSFKYVVDTLNEDNEDDATTADNADEKTTADNEGEQEAATAEQSDIDGDGTS